MSGGEIERQSHEYEIFGFGKKECGSGVGGFGHLVLCGVEGEGCS